jgi:cytochrome o ubiquinol oxidase subunit 2
VIARIIASLTRLLLLLVNKKPNKKLIGAGLGFFLVVLAGLSAWYFHHTTIAVLSPRGPVAHEERQLIIALLLRSMIVVVPVFFLLFFFAWRYRESNTKAKYNPEWDHSRVAETIWWLIPSALILVVGIIIWNSSHTLDPYRALSSSTPPINIEVVALDWKWLFIYPQQHIASVNFLQFPKNTPVNFNITADAPMNSFWIPQLGGQIYAMPGMNTQLHLLASSNGDYYGSSANISGDGFAGMHFVARASSTTDFKQWVNSVKQSSQVLSQTSYGKLSAASTNNQVAYYSDNDPELYDKIILKYIAPLNQQSGDPETQIMQDMDMQ